MMLSDLDGFLTAIAIGPELIMPSEWLPVIWGDDDPVFTEAEMEAVLGGILSRYNQIRHEITNGTFEPIRQEFAKPRGRMSAMRRSISARQACESTRLSPWRSACVSLTDARRTTHQPHGRRTAVRGRLLLLCAIAGEGADLPECDSAASRSPLNTSKSLAREPAFGAGFFVRPPASPFPPLHPRARRSSIRSPSLGSARAASQGLARTCIATTERRTISLAA
jgi:hypothetical protein